MLHRSSQGGQRRLQGHPAEERGVALSDETARELICGMPYSEWKAKYQK